MEYAPLIFGFLDLKAHQPANWQSNPTGLCKAPGSDRFRR